MAKLQFHYSRCRYRSPTIAFPVARLRPAWRGGFFFQCSTAAARAGRSISTPPIGWTEILRRLSATSALIDRRRTRCRVIFDHPSNLTGEKYN